VYTKQYNGREQGIQVLFRTHIDHRMVSGRLGAMSRVEVFLHHA